METRSKIVGQHAVLLGMDISVIICGIWEGASVLYDSTTEDRLFSLFGDTYELCGLFLRCPIAWRWIWLENIFLNTVCVISRSIPARFFLRHQAGLLRTMSKSQTFQNQSSIFTFLMDPSPPSSMLHLDQNQRNGLAMLGV